MTTQETRRSDHEALARYESAGGAYWLEHQGPDEYGLVRYKAGHQDHLTAGGYTTLADLEARIARGGFQPDANTTPMRKVQQ